MYFSDEHNNQIVSSLMYTLSIYLLPLVFSFCPSFYMYPKTHTTFSLHLFDIESPLISFIICYSIVLAIFNSILNQIDLIPAMHTLGDASDEILAWSADSTTKNDEPFQIQFGRCLPGNNSSGRPYNQVWLTIIIERARTSWFFSNMYFFFEWTHNEIFLY